MWIIVLETLIVFLIFGWIQIKMEESKKDKEDKDKED